MSHGFVDLRSGNHAGEMNESFWPSFTDVMMVIVMIFIMASLVMVIKNWELVSELRATIQAEQQAQMVMQTTATTNRTLSEQLTDTQYQLSLLRMQLMQAREQNVEQQNSLQESDRQLQSAQGLIGNLRRQKASAEQTRADTQRQFSRTQEDLSALNQRLQLVLAEQNDLQSELDNKTDNLNILRESTVLSEKQLVVLQQDFSSLQVKYDKLVRPARSAKGKIVVEVRYEKHSNVAVIKYRRASEKTFKTVKRSELDRYLTRLKTDNPGKLYVKIIIPSNSGLSYNEAWKFTSEILAKYDYYHQEEQ